MHQAPTYEVDGDAIRQERMQAGLTRNELATAAGISRRYVAHLENGTRSHMGLKAYLALRDALRTADTRIQRIPPTGPTAEGHTPWPPRPTSSTESRSPQTTPTRST